MYTPIPAPSASSNNVGFPPLLNDYSALSLLRRFVPPDLYSLAPPGFNMTQVGFPGREHWPPPNFVDPEYRGPQMAVIKIVFLTISVTVVCMRLYVRIRMTKAAGLDDWLMLITMPLSMAYSAAVIAGTYYGWGHHLYDMKPEWRVPTSVTSWAGQFLSSCVVICVKLSILTSYLRIRMASKPFHIITWIMIVVTIMWGIYVILIMLLACRPLSAFWNSPPHARCIDEAVRVIPSSASNLATDLIIWALPIRALWRLRLPVKERITLIILMSLGLIACIASAVRLGYTLIVFYVNGDYTWVAYNVWLWNGLEVDLAVICASVPMLRPLARKYFAHWATSRYTHDPESSRRPSMPAIPLSRMKMKTEDDDSISILNNSDPCSVNKSPILASHPSLDHDHSAHR